MGSDHLSFGDGLILLDSCLGFICTGKINTSEQSTDTHSLTVSCDPCPDISRFWEIESAGTSVQSDEEVACRKFQEGIQNAGQYIVRWPWKDDHDRLPTNYSLAFGRLKSLVHRLVKDPHILDKYNSTIMEQLALGIIE